jgi:hypothetical protein
MSRQDALPRRRDHRHRSVDPKTSDVMRGSKSQLIGNGDELGQIGQVITVNC